MYAGRVACCPLVSHVEYAPRAVLRFKTGRPDRYVRPTLTARRGQHKNVTDSQQKLAAVKATRSRHYHLSHCLKERKKKERIMVAAERETNGSSQCKQ